MKNRNISSAIIGKNKSNTPIYLLLACVVPKSKKQQHWKISCGIHVLNSLVICQMAVATFTYQIDTLLHRVCPYAYIFFWSLTVQHTVVMIPMLVCLINDQNTSRFFYHTNENYSSFNSIFFCTFFSDPTINDESTFSWNYIARKKMIRT